MISLKNKSGTKFDFSLSPIKHLQELAHQAELAQIPEYNAMTLSTLDSRGRPRSRVVLFKDIKDDGIYFYTNYESDKGQEIAAHPEVALNIFWASQYVQVRIEGLVTQLSRAESEAYFATRQRLSQIGAWASRQSKPIKSHADFLSQVDFYEESFKNKEVDCPPYWGGYKVSPDYFEFWFGHNGRLHERYVYQKNGLGWEHRMLSP